MSQLERSAVSPHSAVGGLKLGGLARHSAALPIVSPISTNAAVFAVRVFAVDDARITLLRPSSENGLDLRPAFLAINAKDVGDDVPDPVLGADVLAQSAAGCNDPCLHGPGVVVINSIEGGRPAPRCVFHGKLSTVSTRS